MNRIATFVPVAVFGILAIGCDRDDPPANNPGPGDGSPAHSQPPESKRDVMEFTTAEVTIVWDDQDRRVNLTKRIAKQTEIRRLLSFFPDVGRGQHSPVAEPWEGAVKVRFARADGSVVTVRSDYESWNEGHGDWPVEPGFTDYIRELLEK